MEPLAVEESGSMVCVLRIEGENLDVDELAKLIPFRINGFHRVGDLCYHPKGERHTSSGLNFSTDNADFHDFAGQIRDTITFLTTHAAVLSKICSFPGIDERMLDFAVHFRDTYTETDLFPAELVILAAQFKIGLCLTKYPPEGPKMVRHRPE